MPRRGFEAARIDLHADDEGQRAADSDPGGGQAADPAIAVVVRPALRHRAARSRPSRRVARDHGRRRAGGSSHSVDPVDAANTGSTGRGAIGMGKAVRLQARPNHRERDYDLSIRTPIPAKSVTRRKCSSP